MIKIKNAQFDAQNPPDVNVRRLLGQLEQKRDAVNRALQAIVGLDQTVGLASTLEAIVANPDIVRDLEFIFGSEWQTIAMGNI